MKNKTIVIMGGGTAGWVSALYFLNKNLNLNLKVKLISSNDIESIGVGEGVTPAFTNFIKNTCKIDKNEFLKETKGSFKYGIKFNNWNFDNEHYYHLFSPSTSYETSNKDLDYDFIQYIINEELDISQKILQNKLIGSSINLLENNKISLNINNGYAYHFSANLIIPFLKKKCLEFEEFEYIEGTIQNIDYNQKGFIQSLKLDNNQDINGDFFINCLGFRSQSILSKEYFDIVCWNKFILNNSAFAIQVKNSPVETIEPYTTSTAQEYGWSWKIPQYEKTGYGYVYSSDFINDEDKLYNDLLKTYKIKEKNVFKTRVVKSKPYFNKEQFHKNCLSLGLASGFVEPLEATSIHMTLLTLDTFFEMMENQIELTEKYINIFNSKLENHWENVFKFIIFHYFTNNPINDYWKHYKDIREDKIFNFYEKYQENNNDVFSRYNYYRVSLGMKMKDFYYRFSQEKYLKENVYDYLKLETIIINSSLLYSHNEVLNEINQKQNINSLSYQYK
jgi:tryptophan halogenase